MAIVIHTIKGNQYAYNHHREGKKVVCDYLGREGGGGSGGNINKGTMQYQSQEPQVTQQPQRQSNYGNKLHLGFVGNHNGVQIWKSQGATSEQISQVKNMIDRQPLAVRSTVDHIEVFGDDEGQKFKVGDVEFNAGGHWSKKIEGDENRKDNVIRIFGTQGERLLYHESGHSLYTKVNQDSFKETYSTDISNRIYDKVTQHRDNKVKEVRSKFKPLIEAQFEKMDKANAAHDAVVFKNDVKQSIKTELENKYYKEQKKVVKLQKQEQKEIEEVRSKFNPDTATEKYRTSKAPTQRKLSRFSEASWEEGGLSGYTRAYQKANSSSFVDENFAEATNYFFSGTSGDAQGHREKYPKTWAAYRDIVEPRIVGAATEIKYKPKDWIL